MIILKLNIKKILHKYAYRIVPVVVTFVIVLSWFCVPVSATSASLGKNSTDYYTDYYNTDVDYDYNYYYITPPLASYYIAEECRNEYQISIGESTPVISIYKGVSEFEDTMVGPYQLPDYGNEIIWNYNIDFSFFYNDYYLDLSKIVDGSVIDLEFDLDISSNNTHGYVTPTYTRCYISYYDSTGNYITTDIYTDISQDKYYLTFKGRFEVNKPSNAKYACISARLEGFGSLSETWTDYHFSLDDVKVRVGTPRRDIVTQNYRDLYEEVGVDELSTYFFWDVNQEIGSNKLTSGDLNYSLVYGDKFDSLTFVSSPELYDYKFYFRAFEPRRFLELDNIPKDSELYITLDFNIDADCSWWFPFVQHTITYYDANYKAIDMQRIYINRDYEFVTDTKGHTFSYFVLDKPANAKYLTVSVLLQNWHTMDTYDRVPVTVSLDKFQLALAISTIELEKEYENTILDQNDTIIDQNNSLINGTPQQNEQMDSAVGEMGSAGDKLGSLNDQMQVEKPNTDNIDVSIDKLVPFDSVMAYTGPILAFWQAPSLEAMLIIVLTLVLVSWVMFGKKG